MKKILSILIIPALMLGIFSCGENDETIDLDSNKIDNSEFIPESYSYNCDEEFGFMVEITSEENALLLLPDTTVELKLTRSASGAKYLSEDERYMLWTKGNEAIIEFDDISYQNCMHQPDTSEWQKPLKND